MFLNIKVLGVVHTVACNCGGPPSRNTHYFKLPAKIYASLHLA